MDGGCQAVFLNWAGSGWLVLVLVHRSARRKKKEDMPTGLFFTRGKDRAYVSCSSVVAARLYRLGACTKRASSGSGAVLREVLFVRTRRRVLCWRSVPRKWRSIPFRFGGVTASWSTCVSPLLRAHTHAFSMNPLSPRIPDSSPGHAIYQSCDSPTMRLAFHDNHPRAIPRSIPPRGAAQLVPFPAFTAGSQPAFSLLAVASYP